MVIFGPIFGQVKNIDHQSIAKPHKTIVLVHGLYVSSHCWDEWKVYLESKGYTVYVPTYPKLEETPSLLRARQDNKEIADLTLSEVLNHYRSFLKNLKEKPILIGHSMGGLITQVLLNEGLASCAVAIDSVPPKDIVSPFTALFFHGFQFVSNQWEFISPFSSDKLPILLSTENFKAQFANGIPEKDQIKAYTDLVVPTSRRLGKGALSDAAKVDFSAPRAPLLLITGSEDRIIPPSVTKENKAKYQASAGITDYKEFPERGHFLIYQAGWKEICDYSLSWIEKNSKK